jgi:hypothetical protein
MMFEVLHRAFVSLCGFFRAECAEVAPSAGFGVLFARIQPVLSGLKFSDHEMPPATLMPGVIKVLTTAEAESQSYLTSNCSRFQSC